MSFWQLATRLLLNLLGNPAVQGAMKKAGYYAVHKATEAIFRAVKSGNPNVETKSVR
jgi:hypothetical protein